MKRFWYITLILALAASALWVGALGASAESDFGIDDRARADMLAARVVTLTYVPEISGVYDLALLTDSDCAVNLVQVKNGRIILASGAGLGTVLSVRLEARREYTVSILGDGECVAEFMRRSAGRTMSQPARLIAGRGDGLVIREGSAGWFSLMGAYGVATVSVTPEAGSGMDMTAWLYNSEGRLAASSVSLPGGICAVYFKPVIGMSYYLRVSSLAGGKGRYSVNADYSSEDAPDEIHVVTGDLTMFAGNMRSVRARVRPEGAYGSLIWASSDNSVARVSDIGVVTAVAPGEAVISVYAYGGIKGEINVTVNAIEPRDIRYLDVAIGVRVGDEITPDLTVYPSAAKEAGFVYTSSDAAVVDISELGVITALSEGVCTVTAQYGDLTAELMVLVEAAPSRYRALLIGEQTYDSGVNTVRTGSVNTVYNLESLFGTAMFNTGVGIETRVELDLTAPEALIAIADAFSGAKDDDVSILYISCHGYFEDGMAVLQFCDGSELAACDMERALRAIPGTIVLIVDCCDSGGFIDGYSELTGGIVTAFSGEAAPFSGSKYKVLASASLGQDSYRLGYGDGEGDVATVFARALCDGLGWDIDSQRRGSLSADKNYDGSITLWETFQYTARRVGWYLSQADGGTGKYTQDVRVYPEGDGFVLFDR